MNKELEFIRKAVIKKCCKCQKPLKNKGKTDLCKNCGTRRSHDMSKTRVYKIWAGMKQRCLNKNDPTYKNYGGRGIKVCKRWIKFENFFSDIGEPPSNKYSIERIDNNGDYIPNNCKWATITEQANNKRSVIKYNGKTLTEWEKVTGIKRLTLRRRIKSGWSIERTVTEENIKYKGYSFDKNRNKWAVNVKRNGKQYFIGRYDSEEEAKSARAKFIKNY